jgi:hypothetical protein
VKFVPSKGVVVDHFLRSLIQSPVLFGFLLAGIMAFGRFDSQNDPASGKKPIWEGFLTVLVVMALVAGILLLKQGLGIKCNPFPEGY